MEVQFHCPGCGAEMFQGAHFCMACGCPMAQGSSQNVASFQDSRKPAGQKDELGRINLVPDDELEIEELPDLPEETAALEAPQTKQHALEALRQVRDYLIDLEFESKPNGECLNVCRSVMGSLNGSVRQLSDDVAAACRELSLSLDEDTKGHSDRWHSALALVKQKYTGVARLLPELGDFEHERNHRKHLIIRGLLEQLPGFGPLQRDKLQRAGFGEVEKLCQASRNELEAAGLTPELASRVSERVARFKRRLNSTPPMADRSSERERLRQLTVLLKQQNHRFETLASDWSKGSAEARRQLRDERAETNSQVILLLARIGEGSTAERLGKLPFEKRACELDRLLHQLDSTYGKPLEFERAHTTLDDDHG